MAVEDREVGEQADGIARLRASMLRHRSMQIRATRVAPSVNRKGAARMKGCKAQNNGGLSVHDDQAARV